MYEYGLISCYDSRALVKCKRSVSALKKQVRTVDMKLCAALCVVSNRGINSKILAVVLTVKTCTYVGIGISVGCLQEDTVTVELTAGTRGEDVAVSAADPL